MRKYFIVIYLLAFTLITFGSSTFQAESDSKPTLRLYESDGGVKAEWAVEILEEDVLYETGFEKDDEMLPILTYTQSESDLPENRKFGGQTLTKEDKYRGERSLKVENSYDNGNIYASLIGEGYRITSDASRAAFSQIRHYMENGSDLTLSFMAKTTGKGEVRFGGTGGRADFGTPMNITFLEDVKVGDTTVKVSNPMYFKEYVDKGSRFYLANMKGSYTANRWVTEVSIENSTITLNEPFGGEFNKGDPLLRHYSRSPVLFPDRKLEDSSRWELFNVNAKVRDYDDYNTLKRGFYLNIHTTTRDKVYIDDIKVGYATQTELYRDGKKIYEGKLSDFEDVDATDKEIPNKVEDYAAEIVEGVQFLTVEEPKDNGTSYNYYVKAISNDGSGKYDSDIETIEVTSGIKGYSYVIDTNSDTTPSGKINSDDGRIELSKGVYKNHYLHIQAIDNASNKSEVSHIKLDKVEDIVPPTVSLIQEPTEWTNGSVTISVDARDDESGIERISVRGEDQVKNGDFKEGDKYWIGGTGGDEPVKIENGNVILDNGNNLQKLNQQLFKDNLDDGVHYVEIQAKGEGVLNARRGKRCGSAEMNPVSIKNSEFEIYKFIISRDECTNISFVVERIGTKGRIEIKNIKAYEQVDIKNDKNFSVTQNGTYTFVVEDKAGNITTENIEITNIDKNDPKIGFTGLNYIYEDEQKEVTIKLSDDLSGLKDVEYAWANSDSKPSKYEITEELSGSNNEQVTTEVPTDIGIHYLHVKTEDVAGNITTANYKVIREGSISLDFPDMDIPSDNKVEFENITLK